VFGVRLPGRYLATLTDATQAEIVDRAVAEHAARHADEIARVMERARTVLASGDAAIAAYLRDEPVEALERVSGSQPESAKS
jgi:3-methyladenine DNA glycosylase AlkC